MMQGSRLLCKAQRCFHRGFFSRQSLSTLAAVEQHVLHVPNDEMMTDEVAELVEVRNAMFVCLLGVRQEATVVFIGFL
jgi:hypothetical protein